MPIDLTVLLFVDVEKPREWDHRWFDAVRNLNQDAHDRMQVLVISQRAFNGDLVKMVDDEPYEVLVVEPGHPRDASGYPVWDVVQGLRVAWPHIKGEWISCNHIEYIHGPDRLAKACDWLKREQPEIALGNLRRIVAHTGDWSKRLRDIHDPLNEVFADLIDENQWDFLARHWERFGQIPWIYWCPEPTANDVKWWEDVFFVRREFMETIRFTSHGGSLPFQDVYDLMGPALLKMHRHKVDPPVVRMPRDVHEACHVLHDRLWGSYTKTMHEWFLKHADQYRDTTLAREDLWKQILEPGKCGDERPGQAIDRFRRAPGGTVTRFVVDFSSWLQSGGDQQVRDYLEKRKAAKVA